MQETRSAGMSRKRAATRAALADAAFRLAEQRGLADFTIVDVTDRAGVARRTFANHFVSKEQAVAEVIGGAVGDVTAAVTALKPEPTVRQLIDAVLGSALEARRQTVYRTLTDLARSSDELQLWVDSAFADLLEVIHRLLAERSDLPLDPLDLRLLLASADAMADILLESPGPPVEGADPEAVLERLADRLERGFAPAG